MTPGKAFLAQEEPGAEEGARYADGVSWLSIAVMVLAQAAPGKSPQIECTGSGHASVWDRARAPAVTRYCDFLAHAEARLGREPKRAEQSAVAAGNLMPDQAAPRVVQGRAAVAQGKYAEGRKLLEQAQAIDPGALREAGAALDAAVSLRETGDTAGAVAAYQALIPRIDTIAGDEARTRARIDAAVALMGTGPAGLDRAAALLRDASERGAPSLRAAALATLALGLDRAGQRGEAAALAAEALRTGALAGLTAPGQQAATGWVVEGLAVQARLREASEPLAAAVLWEAYLARAGQGPWVAHARARLAELKRAPGGRKGAR